MERCKAILNILKKGETGIIFFTNEKVFMQDIHVNHHNSRVLVRSLEEHNKLTVFQTKHPASVMVFGLIASDDKKMPLVFFESHTRLRGDDYIEVLEAMKTWIHSEYLLARGDDGDISAEFSFTFMQDGAPAHTSTKAQT